MQSPLCPGVGKRVSNYSLPALFCEQEGTRSTPTGQPGAKLEGGMFGEGALSSEIFYVKLFFRVHFCFEPKFSCFIWSLFLEEMRKR